MKLFGMATVVLAAATVAVMWLVPRPRGPGGARAEAGSPAMAPAGKVRLDRTRRSLSLLDDGHADVRLAELAKRPVLTAARMVHLIDLGRWTGALPAEADLLARLPADERSALGAWYANERAVPLRALMPLAIGHLYAVGSGDMGDGRAGALALLLLTELSASDGGAATFDVQLLRREPHPERAQESIAHWLREEKGRRTGYARLYPAALDGDPIKATYSLVWGTRDHRDPFLEGWDLRYGHEPRLLEVRPWALGQGSIAPLVNGAQPWSVPDEMWASALEAVPGTRFAIRLQDDVTDLLAELTVSEMNARGELAFAWRLVDDVTEMVRGGPSLAGRVESAAGEPARDALVWVDGPGLERLPFALRSTRSGADGGFTLPMPAGRDLPVMVSAASSEGAATSEVPAAGTGVTLRLAPAWRLTTALDGAASRPVALRFSADTFSVTGFSGDALALPQLPHARFELMARGVFAAGVHVQDGSGPSGALTLQVRLEPRAALRVVLIDAASGFPLAGEAQLFVGAGAGEHLEQRCAAGEAFLPALPPGRATVRARAGGFGDVEGAVELHAGELAEIELSLASSAGR